MSARNEVMAIAGGREGSNLHTGTLLLRHRHAMSGAVLQAEGTAGGISERRELKRTETRSWDSMPLHSSPTADRPLEHPAGVQEDDKLFTIPQRL